MKNLLVSIIIAVVAMAMVSSCQSYESGSYSHYSSEKTETNAEQVEQNGFILKRVKPGDTLWEYSEEIFGKGVGWREILKENPFLDNPERTYYDQTRKMWIVIIYPGERIKIRGEEVSPTTSSSFCFSSHTITKEKTSIAWWGWVLIGVGAVSIGGLTLMFVRASGTSGRSLAGDAHRTSYRANQKVWEQNNHTILDIVHTISGRTSDYTFDCGVRENGAWHLKTGPKYK
jgi:hypothetical protein